MLSYNKFLTTGGGGGNVINAGGTPPYIPIWTAPNTLGNSAFYQPLAKEIYADNVDKFAIENTDPLIQTFYNYVLITQASTQSSWEYYTQANNGDVSGYLGWYGDDNIAGGSNNFYIQCYASVGNINTRKIDFVCNGVNFLTHEQYNAKTSMYNIDNAIVPLNENSFNLYQGGSKNFNFGAGGVTGTGLFFGNTWMKYQVNAYVNYTFGDATINAGLHSNVWFNAQGGTFIYQQGFGFNTLAMLSGQFTIDIVASSVISDVAGLHIKGMYVTGRIGANSVGITNYYGLLISDSGEQNAYLNGINVSNRYGIVQVGTNDKNYIAGEIRSFGNLGFYGVTPVVQQNTGIASAARTGVGGAAVQANDTFGGYTIGQIVTALKNYGLLN